MFQDRTGIRPVEPLLATAMALGLVAFLTVAGPSDASRVTALTAQLTAEAEVPIGGPDGASGAASILIDLYGETDAPLCFQLTVDGLAEADRVTAAHIHIGETGVAGAIVVPLFTEPPSGLAGCIQDVDLDVLTAIAMDPGGHYVNLHSQAYPGGAVRGQLEFAGAPTATGCTFVAAVGLTAAGEGSEALTVAVEQDLVFWGTFVPGETVELTFLRDGEQYGDFTPGRADAEGYFSFVHDFQAGQEGEWTVIAGVRETECAGAVEITVTAAAAQPTPSPAVPDTALPAPSSGTGGQATVRHSAHGRSGLPIGSLTPSWRREERPRGSRDARRRRLATVRYVAAAS